MVIKTNLSKYPQSIWVSLLSKIFETILCEMFHLMGDFTLLKMYSYLYLNKIGNHKNLIGFVTMHIMEEEVIQDEMLHHHQKKKKVSSRL